MAWKPIVAGVDASPESAAAAATAWKISVTADTGCFLVHATRHPSDIPIFVEAQADMDELAQRMTAASRQRLEDALRDHVPARALERVEVHLTNPTWALKHAVEEHDAGLVVLGGKHHSPPARWLGGSTAHHAVRSIDVPVLITWSRHQAIRRMLVAVDLSEAAKPTLEAAAHFAKLFDAELRALHVVESEPLLDEIGVKFDYWDYHQKCQDAFQRIVADALDVPPIECLTRQGTASRIIRDESAASDTDLVVVGSHGKGWLNRVLIGSTTERLINHLPTSLLVVPIGKPSGTRVEGSEGEPATRQAKA